MDADDASGSGSESATTTSCQVEIEDDLLERAREAYPATSTRRELVRRAFERGLYEREGDLRRG